MSDRVDVAVVDPIGLIGESLISQLDEKEFPVERLIPLSDGESEGVVEFRGKYPSLKDIDGFDFSTVSLVFFCGRGEMADAYAERAVEAGCICIDLTGEFSDDPQVPLVSATINPELLQEAKPGIYAVADGIVDPLATVLHHLHRQVSLQQVTGTLLVPVSHYGRQGVDELASQTVALLNLKEVKQEFFPHQVAFNLLAGEGHDSLRGRRAVREQLLRLWPEGEGLSLDLAMVTVPVFYGTGYSIQLSVSDELSVESLEQALSAVPGVVYGTNESGQYPTPITEAATQDGIYCGPLRSAEGVPGLFQLWIVADNIRRGAVLNALAVAEILVKNVV